MKKIFYLTIIASGFLFSDCDIEDPIIKNEEPTAATITSPSNNSEMILAEEVTLRWNPAIDNDGRIEMYHIFLGKNTTILELIDSTPNTRYKLENLDSLTTYYWQIEAYDNNRAVSYSETCKFTTDDPNAGPILLSPANGTTNVSIPVTFEWDCMNSKIDGYEVYVCKSSGGDNIMVTNTSSYSNLEPGTTYYWWVIGVNKSVAQNSEGYYFRSDMYEFSTK